MTDPIDYLVLGAGRRGLAAALSLQRDLPQGSLRVLEAEPRPGGAIRTQRSNGFSCELGPFAFDPDAIAPLHTLLRRPPAIVQGRCASGWVYDGSELREAALDPRPVSFASGCEELVQACRRELGDALQLGRGVSALAPTDAGWTVTLAGEVPTELSAKKLVCCLPIAEAARLLSGYDPALGEVATHLMQEPHAFVFLGGLASDCRALTGYGIVPADDVPSPLVEVIHSSNVFERRCLPDRFLTRCELAGEAASGDDAELIATATTELGRWTGVDAAFGFTKIHRFETTVHDATWVECQARLRGIAARVDSFTYGTGFD